MKNYGHTQLVGGNIDMNGGEVKSLVIGDDSDSILHSKPGRIVRVMGRILFCVDYEIPGDSNSLPMYVPLAQTKSVHIQAQTEASDTWVIDHGMNTTKAAVQITGPDNKIIEPDEITFTSPTVCTVTFSVPTTGTAIVIAGVEDGMPQPNTRFTQPFTDQSVIVVNHGLGYEPTVRVLNAERFELTPVSIQHSVDANTVTVTLSSATSGTVICI